MDATVGDTAMTFKTDLKKTNELGFIPISSESEDMSMEISIDNFQAIFWNSERILKSLGTEFSITSYLYFSRQSCWIKKLQ